MRAEGTRFVTGVDVGGPGADDLSVEQLRGEFDAVVLAGGAWMPRDLPIPGRDLAGVHFAMDFLPLQNKRVAGDDDVPELTPVTVSEPEQIEVSSGPRRRREQEAERPGLPSYFPKPVYIPQAEYAQMLREQKAAEKAAAAAAAELRELADLDDLAEKEEFSDWGSDR